MKEQKLNNLFESIRREEPETSPDQVASWLVLPTPPASPSPDLVTTSIFTSKSLIIMSIVISAIIATIIIFTPGQPVEVLRSPEINLPKTQPLNEPVNLSPETSSPPLTETSIENNPKSIIETESNAIFRSTNEVPALPSPEVATLSPDSKTPLMISPLGLMPSEPNTSAAQIKIDTLFSKVENIELNCSSCQNIRFNSYKDERVRFKGEIITSDSDNKLPVPEFEFERSGNTLTVTFKPSTKKINFSHNSPKISVDVLFEIPDRVNITSNITYGNVFINGVKNDFCTLKSSSGDITVQNTSSSFEISSTYGNQTYRNIQGPLQLSSSSGNVQLENVIGIVTLKNTYGKIDISNIVGDVNIKGSSTNINASTVKGAVNMVTTYGNINIEKVIGNIYSKVSSGNIKVDQLKGDLKTENTYGKQHFSSILGDIVSSGSSSSFQLKSIQGDIKINTTYGNVLLDTSIGDIDISASNGNVDATNVSLSEMMNISLTYGNIKMKLNNQTSDLSYNLSSNSGNLKIKSLGLKSKKTITYGSGPILVNATTISGNQVFE